MVEDASFDVVALEDARGASHFGGRFEAVRAGNASANIQAQVLERQSELVPPGRTREVSDNGDIDIEQAHFGNLGLVRDVESGKILAIHDDFRQGFSQGELARWLAAHPGPKEVVVVGSVQGRGDTFVRNLVQSTQARRSRLVFVGPQPMDSPGISVHYGAFGDELRIVNPLFPDMAQGSGIAVLPGFKGLKN
jgi:hypothetical protein